MISKTFLKICERSWPKEAQSLRHFPLEDLGFGYDPFGAKRDNIMVAYFVCLWLHRHYFRVGSFVHDPFPKTGRAIFASNHSGTLPIDGAMILTDLMSGRYREDFVRSVIDHFVGHLPFLGDLFKRIGQVIGTRRNFEQLLKKNQAVLIFPEGSKGIVKPVYKRYELQKFNRGFVEMSLRHKAPIVSVAVIGAEEQMPIAFNLKKVGPIPFLPIPLLFPLLGPLSFIPLPVRYEIHYGKVFKFYEKLTPKQILDPEVVENCVLEVKAEIHRLIQNARKNRKGFF